jgi:putative oxidoreductase
MILARLTPGLSRVAAAAAPLVLRIALALPFFRSGLTKWDAPGVLSPGAAYLFSDVFRLHLLGGVYALPVPLLTAYVDGVAEILLPVLLVVGLATRFSALALLIMTGVIQLVVPDGWQIYHLPWAAMALSLIALGPGCLSLDRLLAWRLGVHKTRSRR